MALKKKERKTLKGYFETGDRPTEEDFIELIDSMVIKDEDSINYESDGTTISELNIGDKEEEDPTGSLNVYGSAKISESMNVGADLTIKGNITVEGEMTVHKTEVHEGNVQLGNEATDQIKIIGFLQAEDLNTSLKMKSPMLFEKNVGINTTLTVNGKVHAKDDLDVDKEINVGEKITVPNLNVTNLLQAKDATISGVLRASTLKGDVLIAHEDNGSGATLTATKLVASNMVESNDVIVSNNLILQGENVKNKITGLQSSKYDKTGGLVSGNIKTTGFIESQKHISAKENISSQNEIHAKNDVKIDGTSVKNSIIGLESSKLDKAGGAITGGLTVKEKVGVGTTTPSAELEVDGTVLAKEFKGDGSKLSGITSASIDGTLTTSQIPNLSASKITSGVFNPARIPSLFKAKQISAVDASGLKLYDHQSKGIIIKGGSVGIGTNAPAKKLEVKGTIRADRFELPDGTDISTLGGSGAWEETGSDLYFEKGKVGIGTSTPSTQLEVEGVITAEGFELPDGTDITALGGSSPWNDKGGEITYMDGNVGVGIDSPTHKLHVDASHRGIGSITRGVDGGNAWALASEAIADGGNTNIGVFAKASGSGKSNYGIFCDAVGGETNYALYANGNIGYAGELSKVSDKRLKKNIKALDSTLSKVLQLQGKSYEYKSGAKHLNLPTKRELGFVAQEVEKVFPELVSSISEPTLDDKQGKKKAPAGTAYKSINYISFIPVLVEAMKEQQQIIDQQGTLLEQLTKRVKTLESK